MPGLIWDARELDEFIGHLEKIPQQKEQERKTFMRKEGTKLRRKTVKEASARVRKTAVVRKKWTRVAGQYHKSIKRGRWYKRQGEYDNIRVYSSDPIAHLIELGFTPVLRNGAKGSRVSGKKVFEDAANKFEPEFDQDCDDFAAGYKSEIEK